MPRMSGGPRDAIEGDRAARHQVSFMSGYSEYTSSANGELSALGTALQKPFSRLSLTAKVREVLSGTPIREVDGSVAARIL